MFPNLVQITQITRSRDEQERGEARRETPQVFPRNKTSVSSLLVSSSRKAAILPSLYNNLSRTFRPPQLVTVIPATITWRRKNRRVLSMVLPLTWLLCVAQQVWTMSWPPLPPKAALDPLTLIGCYFASYLLAARTTEGPASDYSSINWLLRI